MTHLSTLHTRLHCTLIPYIILKTTAVFTPLYSAHLFTFHTLALHRGFAMYTGFIVIKIFILKYFKKIIKI